MEDSTRISLPESPIVDRNSNPKLYARSAFFLYSSLIRITDNYTRIMGPLALHYAQLV